MKRWRLESLLDVDLPDLEEARRARMLNELVFWFAVGLAIYTLIGLVGWIGRFIEAGPLFVFVGLAAIGFAFLVYVLNRRGRLTTAAWTFVLVLCAAVVVMLVLYGHRGGIPMLIPVTVLAAALLLNRTVSLGAAVGLGGVYLLIAGLEVSGRWNALLLPYAQPMPADLLISGRLIGIWLAAVLAWIAAGSLNEAVETARVNLRQARRHERELEGLRADLEMQVAARAHELEQALADVQKANLEQATLLDTLRRQAFPVIPVWHKVIALPVVGVLDAARADRLLTSLLDGIQQYGAEIALLDITGAPVIDRQAAQGLVQAVNGARLIGAECVLVGVRPDVAAQLVELEVDLSDLVSRVDMEAGVRYALERLGEQISSRPEKKK